MNLYTYECENVTTKEILFIHCSDLYFPDQYLEYKGQEWLIIDMVKENPAW